MFSYTLDELLETSILDVNLSPLGDGVFVEIARKLHLDEGPSARKVQARVVLSLNESDLKTIIRTSMSKWVATRSERIQ